MSRRRYVVTGRQGQVVQSLLERAAAENGVEIFTLGRPDLELSLKDTIEPTLIASRPDLVISAAAYTAVDQAETDERAAYAINATAVGEIGRIAAKIGVPVVHLSTDYVFDGEKPSPYVEEDVVNPVSIYGKSKLEGENLLLASNADCTILRTAWVYSPFGKNFLRTMLKLAEHRDQINVVADQRGNPTSALDIADGILRVAGNLLSSRDAQLRGVFHMTASGESSWAEYASEIFRLSKTVGGPFSIVHPITTEEYPTPAKRPRNSRLHCQKLQRLHGVHLPDWRIATQTVVKRLIA